MRSVVVVLPASMCALMPMLRYRSIGVVRATVLLFLGLALVAGLTVDVEGSAESASGSKPASSMVKARS
jgi:hypothetical protein